MSKRLVWWMGLYIILAFSATFKVSFTHAESLQSPSYRFDESVVGAGGLIQSSSTSYQGSNSAGDLVVGNTASSNYQIDTGSKTTNDPALSFSVDNASANFGSFSPTTASVTTTNFSVSNYTSYGYVVQIIGNPPNYGSHIISAMSTTDISRPGIEQFGINLVANTSPVSVGENPDNGQFGFGLANANYGTSNSYRYVSGETIASAPKSSGVTTYTISYLVNVTGLTPGGQYNSDQTIIITGTY